MQTSVCRRSISNSCTSFLKSCRGVANTYKPRALSSQLHHRSQRPGNKDACTLTTRYIGLMRSRMHAFLNVKLQTVLLSACQLKIWPAARPSVVLHKLSDQPLTRAYTVLHAQLIRFDHDSTQSVECFICPLPPRQPQDLMLPCCEKAAGGELRVGVICLAASYAALGSVLTETVTLSTPAVDPFICRVNACIYTVNACISACSDSWRLCALLSKSPPADATKPTPCTSIVWQQLHTKSAAVVAAQGQQPHNTQLHAEAPRQAAAALLLKLA